MATPSQVAGYVASNPMDGFWPGLSSITAVFENYFQPDNAVAVNSAPPNEPGIFSKVSKAAAMSFVDPGGILPFINASTTVVNTASESASNALDKAEEIANSAGRSLTSGLDKITSGLEYGIIAIAIIAGLWIVAQASVLIPRRG